jgi:O-antigen/teichoic acid export membrane protein
MRNLIGRIGLPKNRLKWLLSPGGTLSQQVVRGGFWVFALRIVDRLFSLARTIVLARLLAPKDFGLFGIALLAMSALETFSQTGFQQALIQQKKDIRPYLDTTWTVQVIRGSVLALILFGISPYVAAFFGEPAAAALLRVLGLSMLFQGFANIGVVYFQKELEFRKQFVFQLSGTPVDFVVAITAALLLRNAWALIFGLLAANFVRMVVSYLIHPYRPRVQFEGAKVKELYSFGRWVLGSSVLVFLTTQGDDIFVGKFLGVTALGLYQLAYQISNMPATEITHVIAQVTFPTYSKLQNDLPKLGEAYLKVVQVTAFISTPLAGMIFILSREFTHIFLGEKWLPIVPAMQILVLAGLVRSVAGISGYVFQGMGSPKIDTILQMIRLSVLAIAIYPLTTRWGISGASLAVLLSILVSGAGFGYMSIRITRCAIRELFKAVAFPIANGLIMVSVIYVTKSTLPTVGILQFVLSAAIGVMSYLAMTWVLDRFFNYGIYSIIRQSLRVLRGV